MNFKKIFMNILVCSIFSMSGCSSHSKINQLSSDTKILNNKVDKINTDINSMRSDIKIAKDNASRANHRLDNQVFSYRK